MKVITCYTADIKSQLTDKGTRQVDDRLMRVTADTCLDALRSHGFNRGRMSKSFVPRNTIIFVYGDNPLDIGRFKAVFE